MHKWEIEKKIDICLKACALILGRKRKKKGEEIFIRSNIAQEKEGRK